ncbi:hypothetical protein BH20ACI3_BH20ACI3_11450 [soil metagenome]
MYETLNSYSMIAKTIKYDGPGFHPLATRLHKREASRQSSLRGVMISEH